MTQRKRDNAPYRIKIEPTFGIQARVRAWHRSSPVPILDRSVWAPNVKVHAESLARAAIALDRTERRRVAHEHKKNLGQGVDRRGPPRA